MTTPDEHVEYECRVHGPDCYGCVFETQIVTGKEDQ